MNYLLNVVVPFYDLLCFFLFRLKNIYIWLLGFFVRFYRVHYVMFPICSFMCLPLCRTASVHIYIILLMICLYLKNIINFILQPSLSSFITLLFASRSKCLFLFVCMYTVNVCVPLSVSVCGYVLHFIVLNKLQCGCSGGSYEYRDFYLFICYL